VVPRSPAPERKGKEQCERGGNEARMCNAALLSARSATYRIVLQLPGVPVGGGYDRGLSLSAVLRSSARVLALSAMAR
jgi:hypothetical protein